MFSFIGPLIYETATLIQCTINYVTQVANTVMKPIIYNYHTFHKSTCTVSILSLLVRVAL